MSIKTCQSKHVNQNMSIKTCQSKHVNQNMSIKTVLTLPKDAHQRRTKGCHGTAGENLPRGLETLAR